MPGESPVALKLSGVVKRYGANTVLDHAELVLAAGEVRGLVGPNGSGKTTLLRIVLGLVAPDAGTVEVLARPVGAIIEHPAFYPYLSARANLELLAAYDRGAGLERIDDVLAATGLGQRSEDRVGSFSAGMRQRLGIAAAILRGPRLLLFDEPTSALDPDGVAEAVTLIRRLADDSGVAALIASHQMDVLAGLVDGYSRLQGGVLVDG